MLCYRATRQKAVDLFCVEAQLLENFFIVFAKFRGSFCRHLSYAVDLNWTADRRRQLAAGAFKRNDDIIRAKLRIVDHFLWVPHCAERDVDVIEDFVEDSRQLRHVRHQVRWGEPWIS